MNQLFLAYSLIFCRHNKRNFKILGNKNNFSTLDPPYFKPFGMLVEEQFFVLVVSSKLSWGCTFENVMLGTECLIYQSGPSYDELKMCFMGV